MYGREMKSILGDAGDTQKRPLRRPKKKQDNIKKGIKNKLRGHRVY
jgi:hypothetical protein